MIGEKMTVAQFGGAQFGGVNASASPQELAKAEVGINCAQAQQKLNKGDLKGAIEELTQACNALKDAGKGAETASPPGQQLNLDDLLKQLRDIIDQGKKQSAESPANQAAQGAQSGQGAQGGQQGGIEQILQMIMELLQKLGGGGQQAATA